MEVLTGFASSIARDLVCGAVNEVRYCCCFNNFVEDLQKDQDKFIKTRNSVQDRVRQAKKQTRRTDDVVHGWLEQANNVSGNVEESLEEARTKKSCCLGNCPNWIWRYLLGRQLAEKQRIVKSCIEQGSQYIQIERLASLPGLESLPSRKCLKFDSRQSAFEELMKALKNDELTMIGLYRMGGCGKTTMAMEVGNEAKHLFNKVLFVPVSSTAEVLRIQAKIASSLEFELQEREEIQRAQRLRMRLSQEDKILVILDDVWQMLELEDIGIPSSKNHKGCKVLITTRIEAVCTLMDCQRKIHLLLLSDDEAWDLFQKRACISEGASDTLKQLARQISDECKGLPVAIAAVASTLKGKADVEWKNALNRLRGSKPVNIEKGLQNPYSCLQLSYDYLDIKEAKLLLLLCSMFPEDYEIEVEDLTRIAIGLGIVEDFRSYEEARNEVSAAKNKLISSCLLSASYAWRECVKMHDLVRDVAHWIAKNENKAIECALERVARVDYSSIRYLWCEEFPNQLDCSNLEFLRIRTDSEVSDEIFKAMGKLRVLILANKDRYKKMPLSTKSFKSLINLRSLILEGWKLGDISFVGDLKKLESLAMRCCSFLELPNDDVFKQLTNLRLLELFGCDFERKSLEVIGGYSQLEELYVLDPILKVEFFNKFSVPQALQRYDIALGTGFRYFPSYSLSRTLSLGYFHTSNAAIKDLAKKAESLILSHIEGGAKHITPDIFQIEGGGMNELIELSIDDSEEIECLADTSNHLSEVGTLFSKLLSLTIKNMKNFGALYRGLPPSGLFEKLEKLSLDNCPQLTYLFTLTVARSLVQLQKLKIFDCRGLEHILIDHDTDEIITDDHRLVFPKLKEISVRRCDKLEYIIPITFAKGLLQLKCLEIKNVFELKYIFGQCKYGDQLANQSQNELKIELPIPETLTLINLPNIISICPENCCGTCPTLHQFHLQNCPEFAIMSINTCMEGSKVAKQSNHSTTKLIGLSIEDKESQHFPNLHLESNQLDDFPERTSIPVTPLVNFLHIHQSSGLLFNYSNLTRLMLYSCSLLGSLFTPSTAKTLTSLEELIIKECHGLKHIVTCESTHKNKEEIAEDIHDFESHISMFPSLKKLDVLKCDLLQYTFPASFARGLLKLTDISIIETLELKYLFGPRNFVDRLCHQHQNKIQIELPVLEKLKLQSMPNLINICPDSYYVTCSSIRRLWLNSVGLSILEDPGAAVMINEQILRSIMEGFPVSGGRVISRLDDLSLVNLPKLGYIWRGAKHSVTLQNLYELHISRFPKLKAIFSASVMRSLPLLKFLVVKECEELEQIIEDEENENVSNPQSPKICFSQLKLLIVEQCNKLKRLFYISTSLELPELRCLIIIQNSHLKEVFEVEQGAREGRVKVLIPKLKHVVLVQLPNLNNFNQGIEFQSLRNHLMHDCPKLSIASTTTIEDMLKIYFEDMDIFQELYNIHGIIKETINKDLVPELSPKHQASSESDQMPSSEINDANQSMVGNLDGSPHEQKLSSISSLNLTKCIDMDIIKERVQEGSALKEAMKAISLAIIEGVDPGVNMLVQDAQGVQHRDKLNEGEARSLPCQNIKNGYDTICKGSNLMDKEFKRGVVSNNIIEVFSGNFDDSCRSHSLITTKLEALNHFIDLNDAQIAILVEAIGVYPHLWDICEKFCERFSERFQDLMLKTLVDMLLFLRSESAVSVTIEQKKKFYTLCDEAIHLGFEKSWVNEMRQRVMVGNPGVDHAQAQLSELIKRRAQLTLELSNISSEINGLNDFIDSQKKCFDFL